MMQWNLFVLAVLFSWISLYGASCCGQGEATAELLYVRPYLCDLDYAIEDPRSFVGISQEEIGPLGTFLPYGKMRDVCPNREPAFRVGLAYLTKGRCVGVGGLYTRVFAADTRHAVAPGEGGLWVVHAHPRFNNHRFNSAFITNGFEDLNAVTPIPEVVARIHLRSALNVVDGVGIGQNVIPCGLWLRAQLGVRWMQLVVKEELAYAGIIAQQRTPTLTLLQNALLEVHGESKTWGVGPRAALSVRYAVGCGFGIGGQVGGSMLVGAAAYHNRQHVTLTSLIQGLDVNLDEELDVQRSGGCHLVPEWDARLGLNYRVCCGSWFSVMVEAGWECVSFLSAIGKFQFNDAGGTCRRVCEHFNLDGLYFSLRITI